MSATIMSFTDLKVWQQAHEFALSIYNITKSFPKNETQGLALQLRECASAIATGIVKGKAKKDVGHFIKFLAVSQDALQETKYFLILSKDLGYIEENVFDLLMEKSTYISRMINKLVTRLEQKE